MKIMQFEKLGFELGDTEVEVDDSVNQTPEVEYVLTKPVRCHEVGNAGQIKIQGMA